MLCEAEPVLDKMFQSIGYAVLATVGKDKCPNLNFFREYACDFIPIFVLCQVFVSDSDLVIKEAAFLLIHILKRQFLDGKLLITSTSEILNDSSDMSMKTDNDHAITPKLYQNTQYDIIRQLARTYPQTTMPVFSG